MFTCCFYNYAGVDSTLSLPLIVHRPHKKSDERDKYHKYRTPLIKVANII